MYNSSGSLHPNVEPDGRTVTPFSCGLRVYNVEVTCLRKRSGGAGSIPLSRSMKLVDIADMSSLLGLLKQLTQ